MKEKKSPSPPSLPPDAQREILDRLSAETRISSQEIAAMTRILMKPIKRRKNPEKWRGESIEDTNRRNCL